MSFNIVLLGEYSKLMQELIIHGYIIPKPEGVKINTLSLLTQKVFLYLLTIITLLITAAINRIGCRHTKEVNNGAIKF